jgi:hypothetical protein
LFGCTIDLLDAARWLCLIVWQMLRPTVISVSDVEQGPIQIQEAYDLQGVCHSICQSINYQYVNLNLSLLFL